MDINQVLEKQKLAFVTHQALVMTAIPFCLMVFTVNAYFYSNGSIFRIVLAASATFLCFLGWYGIATQRYIDQAKTLLSVLYTVIAALLYFINGGYSSPIAVWLIATPLMVSHISMRHAKWSLLFLLLFISITFITDLTGLLIFPTPEIEQSLIGAIHIPLALIFSVWSLFQNLKNIELQSTVLQNAINTEHQYNMQLNSFMSNISHELRTPLGGIFGALQLLKGHSDDERKLIQAAKTSSQSLNRIVSDILDLQKLSEGKIDLAPQWVNTQTLFGSLENLYNATASLKGIDFSVSTNDLPTELFCDDVRIGQILNNIVGNAFKFTEQGSITIHAYYSNGHLHVSIADTGIGMTPQSLQKLFDRFTQADSSITKKYAGSGLGMTITKELMELMAGEIAVESNLQSGTTFKLILPLESRDAESFTPDHAQQLTRIRNLTILFVEDNEINQLVGEACLTRYFRHIDIASDGLDALKKVRQKDYDIVVTDISMPNMDGEALQQELASLKPTLPVIALTGNAYTEDREKYLQAGFAGVETKPFVAEELVALINDVVDSK